jgi:hypothetical protein
LGGVEAFFFAIVVAVIPPTGVDNIVVFIPNFISPITTLQILVICFDFSPKYPFSPYFKGMGEVFAWFRGFIEQFFS